jgi:hypothetical protein
MLSLGKASARHASTTFAEAQTTSIETLGIQAKELNERNRK